jgi:hypothetical protein
MDIKSVLSTERVVRGEQVICPHIYSLFMARSGHTDHTHEVSLRLTSGGHTHLLALGCLPIAELPVCGEALDTSRYRN